MNGEFKYEQEVRHDEERIARYFETLPAFLDLPGENEAVLERMSRSSGEKVLQNSSVDHLRRVVPDLDFSVEIDEENASEYIERAERMLFRTEDNEMLDILDGFAVVYSERYAMSTDDFCSGLLVGIVCQSSKTLARISDLLYAGDDERDMKIALAKRVLRDLNDLAAQVLEFGRYNQRYPGKKEVDVLQIVRQKILNILLELQKN